MEHWHLEGPGGDILCGAKHGIIQPRTLGGAVASHGGPGGPICPLCLRIVGLEQDEIQKRAQERAFQAWAERGEYPPEVEAQGIEGEWEEWYHNNETEVLA